MKGKRALIQLIFRALHAALVLFLSYLLFRAVYHAFSLLANEPQPGEAIPVLEEQVEDRGPSPQEIAESLNTHWLTYDEYHYKNVCEASRLACRLRNCDMVEGVRNWD